MTRNKLALIIMLITSSSLTFPSHAEGLSAVAGQPANDDIAEAHPRVAPATAGVSQQAVETPATPLAPPMAVKNVARESPVTPPAESASSAQTFTPEQEIQIGQVVNKYLLSHPEILVEVSKKLEEKQRDQQLKSMTQAVLRHQEALLDDKSTPSYGPEDAKVALIEFFDYQCSVCAHQAPIIESLMKANPQVRYVFKEWPIFAHRWAPSLTAAKRGIQVWQEKGAEAYMTYHNALYATGHDEGQLTQADITRAASQVGKLSWKSDAMLEVLARTDVLAQNLGLRGTPGIIVMPVNGATAANVTVIPGGVDQSTLQAAIDKASGPKAE